MSSSCPEKRVRHAAGRRQIDRALRKNREIVKEILDAGR
jgi:hypothetical protein